MAAPTLIITSKEIGARRGVVWCGEAEVVNLNEKTSWKCNQGRYFTASRYELNRIPQHRPVCPKRRRTVKEIRIQHREDVRLKRTLERKRKIHMDEVIGENVNIIMANRVLDDVVATEEVKMQTPNVPLSPAPKNSGCVIALINFVFSLFYRFLK